MPELAELKAAKPGQIAIDYKGYRHRCQAELPDDRPTGRQTRNWCGRFTAGSTHSSDDGADAMAGLPHHAHGTMMKQ